MPEIDVLMQEWPTELEDLLKEVCSFRYYFVTISIVTAQHFHPEIVYSIIIACAP